LKFTSQRIRNLIETCPIVRSSSVTYDKRSSYEGFIRGELHFVDGSILYLREFVDVEMEVERLMYVYQYMNAANGFVFRYDNTGHHKKLNIPTYPHHKHEGDEMSVVASSAPTLAEVLDEVAGLIQLP